MLYIKKNSAPADVLREIAELKSTPEWRALSDDDTEGIRNAFDRLNKDIIRAPLLEDQHYLCAYCMRKIRNGSGTTIEHFKPLSRGKENALDYNNFLVVCDGGKDSDHCGGHSVLCCDAAKANTELNHINPMDAACMSRITYTRQGLIGYKYPDGWSDKQKEAVDDDLNKTLQLNGEVSKGKQSPRDTDTRLIKNRKDAYERYNRLVTRWDSNGKLTVSLIEKTIRQLLDAPEREEYVGVVVYFLARKARQLSR